MSTVVNRPSGRTPGPTNLGHRIQFRLTTSLKAYLIPPGYEAKLRPSALLSYEGERCFPLHKGNAGLFDSVAFAPESFQNIPVSQCFAFGGNALHKLGVCCRRLSPFWANSRAHTFGPWFSSDNKHRCLIWVPYVTPMPALYLCCRCQRLIRHLTQHLIL